MDEYLKLIRQALAVSGGHMFVGVDVWGIRGTSLTHALGAPSDEVLELAINEGLPVIDIRACKREDVEALVVTIPRPAVACEPDPGPWGQHDKAPLEHLAGLWKHIGATTHNI